MRHRSIDRPTSRTTRRLRSGRRALRCCRRAWRPPLSAARETHDLVGRELPRAAAPHVLDQRAAACPPIVVAAGLLHADGVAVDLELDLGIRQESELLADIHRDGDLALAGDAHRYYSYQ